MDYCPVCGEKAIAICKCFRADSNCKNGHNWHTCVIHNKIVIGESDHKIPIDRCTCVIK